MLDQDRNQMFAEAIDVILEIWKRDPPYDIDLPNNRFKVSTGRTSALEIGVGYLARPFQNPRPEIVGTVLAPYSKGVVAMGQRDFHPLSANFLLSKWVRTHWANYVEGKTLVGGKASRSDWRVARTIFVADDDKIAKDYGRTDPASPYAFYYSQILKKLHRSKRLFVMKTHPEQPDAEITHDYVMDALVMHGSVNSVVDQILALREEIGDFGELVYAGMDFVDPELARRSMRLMAEEVMPRVNAAIREVCRRLTTPDASAMMGRCLLARACLEQVHGTDGVCARRGARGLYGGRTQAWHVSLCRYQDDHPAGRRTRYPAVQSHDKAALCHRLRPGIL